MRENTLPPRPTIPSSASGQRSLFADAYSVLTEAIRDHALPGAAFGVLAKGRIMALDGVGRFTYDEQAQANTPSSVFDLASLTKVLATTSMAMLLCQRGALALDQPLVDLLPAFARKEAGGGPRHRVTLRMLLAHSSGMPGYVRLFESCHDRDALFNACLDLPLEMPPGTRAEYSDPGFILLGRALEILAGESLDAFCAREIFAPLGMSSTRFRPPQSWQSSIPPTEDDAQFRHRVIQGEVQDENCFVLGGVSGHAGLFSNALDPLRYAQSLLGPWDQSEGDLPVPQLFSPGIIGQFTARAESPPGSSRALGWDTPSVPSSSGKSFSPHSAGHLGYAGTSLWIDFERRLAIVLLTNRTWPRRQSEAIRQVRPVFHDAISDALDRS